MKIGENMDKWERHLLDALRDAHNDILWALEFCEDGKMPAEGVNHVREARLNMREALDKYRER
jgi:hypothetical protein